MLQVYVNNVSLLWAIPVPWAWEQLAKIVSRLRPVLRDWNFFFQVSQTAGILPLNCWYHLKAHAGLI